MNSDMKIVIGCDHAGVEHKNAIIKDLEKHGIHIIDKGTYSSDSVDYPDYAHPVALSVETGDSQFGILICGSANGVCITANKHAGVRAALCWNNEVAKLARQHNDANIICLPARFISVAEAIEFTHSFLNTEFEGGRHQTRVDKIAMQN